MTDKELLNEAISGLRGDDQRLIAEEVVRWGALLIRKNTDYGSSVWQSPVLAPECDPGTAIRVRMSDKLSRLQQLLSKPAMVGGESFNDTLRDFGAYCLLELARPKPSDRQSPPVFGKVTEVNEDGTYVVELNKPEPEPVDIGVPAFKYDTNAFGPYAGVVKLREKVLNGQILFTQSDGISMGVNPTGNPSGCVTDCEPFGHGIWLVSFSSSLKI